MIYSSCLNQFPEELATFHFSMAPIILCFLIVSSTLAIPFARALSIGLHADAALGLFKHECSRTCESKYCDAAPFLRYGKYCGLLYSGCPGESPCDRLDSCCMHHDQCIVAMNNNYLSEKCNNEFLKCVDAFKRSGAPSFKGNTCDVSEVVNVINIAMRAAIAAGKIVGKS